MKTNEKFGKKLLVEGKDDQHVIWALCEKFKIPEAFDVIDCDGIDNLYDEIPLRFKQSGVQTIGIVIDADINLQNRWISVRGLLEKQGFEVPRELPEEGLVLSNNVYKVGVWVMPNNKTNGMLEDFVSFLVPQEDKLLPVVDVTLVDIENKNFNKYIPAHKSKARIHTWLSWQEDPGTPMGLSITKKYLTEDNNCKQFINWLQILFAS